MTLDERGEVEALVKKGGGVFSSDLRKEDCTHLIAQTPTGIEYINDLLFAICRICQQYMTVLAFSETNFTYYLR